MAAKLEGIFMDLLTRITQTITTHGLADVQTPVLLMVSGGSDSTALTYLAKDLADQSVIGPLAMLHMNHGLRGAESDADAAFVQQLADLLDIPLYMVEARIADLARSEGGNVEAVARRERYASAADALRSLCTHFGYNLNSGRIFVAHTQDDRVENFFMRSIVGTGPGGFRSMTYQTHAVCRPLLDVSREDLRGYIMARAAGEQPVCISPSGMLWCEDSTNECTDYFRNFVRKEIVPKAKERNPKLLDTLCRSMNLIADEDDYLAQCAEKIYAEQISWISALPEREPEYDAGCTLLPGFGAEPLVLQRRVVHTLLQNMLGYETRVDTASVQAILDAFEEGHPKSGYVTNIQGDLAVSSNKRGVLIEPMSSFRARRKKK